MKYRGKRWWVEFALAIMVLAIMALGYFILSNKVDFVYGILALGILLIVILALIPL